jgi:chemotaxis protein MotB
MFTTHRRQKGVTFDIWPGFVDALATLLIVMIFALMIFFVAQLQLSTALQGSKRGLEALQAKLQEISALLLVEQKKTSNLTATNTALSASATNLTTQLNQLQALKNQIEVDLSAKIAASDKQALDANTQLAAIQKQVEELNQKLQALNAALQVSEDTSSKQKLKIEDLDKKLTAALAQKVENLAKYRSEFLEKLKDLLANRADIHIAGDRFVFQSEVLFPTGSATLEARGEEKLEQLAKTLKEIAAKIPKDLKWVLRVDGHTDKRPIHTDEFESNWDLSAARALSVVKFLIKEGIPSEHLAAAGFGEFHPIEEGDDEPRNRRIELKLDQR